MAALVYILCFLTAMGCAAALFHGYRQSGAPLLGWSALCFVGLAANDGIVLVDIYVIGPDTSLLILRTAVGLVAVVFLLWGLVFHGQGGSR